MVDVNKSVDVVESYINTIKPFHTKIVEANTTYSVDESISVTVTESFNLTTNISIIDSGNPNNGSVTGGNTGNNGNNGNNGNTNGPQPDAEGNITDITEASANHTIFRYGGWGGLTPFGASSDGIPVTPLDSSSDIFGGPNPGYSQITNEIAIPGNMLNVFTPQDLLEIKFELDGIIVQQDTVPLDNIRTVQSVENVQNIITMLSFAPLPNPPTDTTGMQVYVDFAPFDVTNTNIGYGTAEVTEINQLPYIIADAANTTNPNEYVDMPHNSLLISGDKTTLLSPGVRVKADDDKIYTILMSVYNSNDTTSIRLLETITNSINTIKIHRFEAGYDQKATNLDIFGDPDTTIVSRVDETLKFHWVGDNGPVIDGYQHIIQSTSSNTITLNATTGVQVGDTIVVLYNDSVSGEFEVTDVEANSIQVNATLLNSVGGIIEKT